jgi:hypothetical protein
MNRKYILRFNCFILLSFAAFLSLNAQTDTIPQVALKADSVGASKLSVPDSVQKVEVKRDSTSLSIGFKGAVFSDGYDRVFMKNGDVLVCNIKDQNLYVVRIVYPLNTAIEAVNTSDIHYLNFFDGRYQLVNNKPEIVENRTWAVVVSEKDWEKVEITEDASLVSNLVEKGVIKARYTGKQTATNQYLEKSASIILRKKAARMKASVVVVSEKNVQRDYGELPVIDMKGIAYGYPDEVKSE